MTALGEGGTHDHVVDDVPLPVGDVRREFGHQSSEHVLGQFSGEAMMVVRGKPLRAGFGERQGCGLVVEVGEVHDTTDQLGLLD